jgi:hypothetical protein
MREQRLVEADQRLDAVDDELVERAQHPPARVLAVDAVDDELRDHRVVQRRDLAARRRRRSRRARRARRLVVAVIVPGAGQEAVARRPPR